MNGEIRYLFESGNTDNAFAVDATTREISDPTFWCLVYYDIVLYMILVCTADARTNILK